MKNFLIDTAYAVIFIGLSAMLTGAIVAALVIILYVATLWVW